MPGTVTRKQLRFLLSKGSKLTAKQKAKFEKELKAGKTVIKNKRSKKKKRK